MLELHRMLFTPSLLRVPFYTPSLVGFFATSGVLFLLMLLLRTFRPLRRVIPAARGAVLPTMLFSSIVLSLELLQGIPAERWDLDLLWSVGYLLLVLSAIHGLVHLLNKRSI